jgi:hypothetical protein
MSKKYRPMPTDNSVTLLQPEEYDEWIKTAAIIPSNFIKVVKRFKMSRLERYAISLGISYDVFLTDNMPF